ncbi:MAG: BACON domain-containing carbohydrate-binding protein, partial [Candidatus Solibacter sp.]
SKAPEPAVIAPATTSPTFSGFQGLTDNFTAIPPDTQGAVGPQHVVTMLNTQVMIQSRSGVARANYPITLNAFWSPLGNFGDVFDPRIQYDSTADRWISCAAVNGETSSSALLVAVTQTGDPGAAWNYYKVDIGVLNRWGDFPALGFNANWVAVSMNLFQIRGSGSYTGTNLYVFSKADLYQKGAGTYVTFTDTRGEFTPVRDDDNSHPNTMYLMQEFATDFGPTAGSGAIRVSKLEGVVGAETFRGGNVGTVTVPEPWSDTGPNEADFGPQQGTSVKIDTGDSRLVNCVMRSNTIWCAHTVYVPYAAPTRAAAQWFQIDPSGSTPTLLQRGRIDDPTNTYSYAYPSIAVNRNNEALIGYTRFSATDYPSAGFAVRLPSDPSNAMQPGVIVKAGETSYISPGARSGANRWGDYSATMVDPANDLDFWTLQEYAATPPGNRTGAFATWWARVTAPSNSQDCTYSLTPATASFDNNGGSGTVTVSTAGGCVWQAASNTGWITIASGNPGSGSGTVQFTVAKTPTANEFRSGNLTIAGKNFTITQGTAGGGSSAPIFTTQGIVSAASLQGGAVAPGEVITIFGSNIGPPTLQVAVLAPSGQFDTLAGGTRILFDGSPAPMLYAVSGQAGAVVPFGLQQRTTTQLQVEYLGSRSSPITLAIASTAPAIFTANQSGKGQGSILNQDYKINSANAPAARGSVVAIYATGGGAMAASVIDGSLAQAPFSTTAQNITARIGGIAAQVLYQGAAPGLVQGVLQINVVVPAGTIPSDMVSVDFTIGGVTSPSGVTLAVR